MERDQKATPAKIEEKKLEEDRIRKQAWRDENQERNKEIDRKASMRYYHKKTGSDVYYKKEKVKINFMISRPKSNDRGNSR